MYWLDSKAYFVTFLLAAFSADSPGAAEDSEILLAASVSVTVTSQIRLLPEDQGIWVAPSGRLPSVLDRPDGSLTDEIPALMRVRQMISLRCWCLPILPADFLQTRPCRPLL